MFEKPQEFTASTVSSLGQIDNGIGTFEQHDTTLVTFRPTAALLRACCDDEVVPALLSGGVTDLGSTPLGPPLPISGEVDITG